MPEIKYQALQQHLKETGNTSFPPVYLIYGEDFLYEQIAKHIVDVIIPDVSKQKYGHEIIRHRESIQIIDVIEKLNTYAFFNQKRIIELRDSNIFVSSRNQGGLIGKIKKAYDNSDLIRAIQYYLDLLGRLNISLDDVCDENIVDLLGIESDEFQEIQWLLAITEEAKKNSSMISQSANDSGLLEKALVGGFAQNNHLIILTDTIDKRSSLYQSIKQNGVIIDCTISRGSRKVDKETQRQTLINLMNRELKKYHKEMDPDAFEILYEKIGFDIRTFSSCLEKTIQYVGDRAIISLRDVEAVSHQVRQDPIYELTGAILEKKLVKSLNYLVSLLDNGCHPLQILTAITNQFRRLLLIKGFLNTSIGSIWRKGIPFHQFQSNVFPAIRSYDDSLLTYLDKNEYYLRQKSGTECTVSKSNISSDLLLIKRDQHPYAVYALFLKADMFEEKEITLALMNLSQADAAMKTSGQRPKSVLEELIIKICRPKIL
jgi:DNA polymerase III subunit delta